ncbi:MAG TPA: hypothetical protein VHM26_14625, partial [Chitinophagaceae bacterium]|nr:hypothetical protein [Chitinophagaceae bacterium]
MLRRFSFILTAALLIALSFSCKKNSDSQGSNTLFYGKWKTSYNDTIEFTHENGKDYVIYDESMNPSMPTDTKSEFRYEWEKLHIRMPASWSGMGMYPQ